MMAAARFLIMGFAVLTIIYLCLWLYFRAARREELETEWLERGEGDRNDYVARGLQRQAPGLRDRLLAIVYGGPILLFFFLVFATDYM